MYAFVVNRPSFLIDIYGKKPTKLGAVEGRKCEGRRRAMMRRLSKVISKSSGKTPDCSGERGCTLITVIVEVGDPCGNAIDRQIGHTGIAIGNDYRDFGPRHGNNGDPGHQWWDDPKNEYWNGKPPGNRPEDINLDDIIDNIHRLSPQAAVAVEFCACEETTRQIRRYWDWLYKAIADGKPHKWTIGGAQCTSTVCSSIRGRGTSGLTSPNSFLFNQLSRFKNGCGRDKGKKANIKILKGFDR